MLAAKIKELRGKTPISTAALEAKVALSIWYGCERGEKVPHKKNIIKMAEYFNVDPAELLALRDQRIAKNKQEQHDSPYKRNCFAFDPSKMSCVALEEIDCDHCKFYKTPAQISIERRATDKRLAKLSVLEQERIRQKYSEVQNGKK